MDDGDDPPQSRPPEPDDVRRLSEALNQAGARYVLIGGYAMVLHGAGRTTMDIDFLVDDAPENVARVKRALSVLADNAAADVSDGDLREFTVVRVADEVVVDLLGRACGVDYSEAIRDAETHDLDGVPVPVASKATLVKTKQSLRERDRADRQWLEYQIAKDREDAG